MRAEDQLENGARVEGQDVEDVELTLSSNFKN